MIHNRKLYLILALLLIINVTFEPIQKAETAALSLGSIYGTSLGTKLLAFILASTSVGVTFKALEEAEKMFDKWQLDSNNWEPPGDNPNNNWAELLQAMLGASLLQDRIPAFINSIKDFFQNLGAEEGDNILLEDSLIYYDLDENVELGSKEVTMTGTDTFSYSYKGFNYSIRFNCNNQYGIVDDATVTLNNVSMQQSVVNVMKYSTIKLVYPFEHTNSYGTYLGVNMIAPSKNKVFTIRYTGANHGVITDYEKPELDGIKYNVYPNSTVITGITPPNTPQPPIINIPYETNITSEGQEETYYIGDLNDLTNDVVNNTTWQDLINTSINYQTGTSEPAYTLTPTDEGVKIITEPETENIPTPYPNPEFEPIEDTSEYQGKSIGLLQSIINWLKLIYDSIQKFFEMPDDLTLDTTSLRLVDFQFKFPFSIPWDLYNSINVFAETPSEPELIIDLDSEYLKVNHEIDISSIYLPLTFARYVATIFFIIFLANKTRDLIKW